jgi:hypothetical protein
VQRAWDGMISGLMNMQGENSAAKCALNLQIRREEFTACLRSALRATCQTHCKRTMKLMTEGRS